MGFNTSSFGDFMNQTMSSAQSVMSSSSGGGHQEEFLDNP